MNGIAHHGRERAVADGVHIAVEVEVDDLDAPLFLHVVERGNKLFVVGIVELGIGGLVVKNSRQNGGTKLLGECKIYLLPHPANHLANDYRKYVLLGKILRALLQTHFYDNVAMPNFYDILKNDKESDETFGLTKELLQLNLVDYTSSHEDSGLKFNKSGSYEHNKITYQVCLDKSSILQVIFRYSSDEEKDYTVSWACYYPESGEK